MIKQIHNFLFDKNSFSLTSFELTFIRILFAIYFFLNFPLLITFKEQPYPHGFAQFFDLTIFGDPAFHVLLQTGTILALVFYCSGRFMTPSIIFLLIATIGPSTLFRSQGYTAHYNHIVSLILLAQLIAYLYADIVRHIHNRKISREIIENASHFFSRQAIAYVYVVAAISKITESNGTWPLRAVNLAPAVVKTHAHLYYDELQTGLIERGEWIASLIIDYTWIFVFILFATIVFELVSFLGVFNRNLAIVIGIGLIIMHGGIKWTMGIVFKHNEFMIFLFFILPFLLNQMSKRRLFKIPISNDNVRPFQKISKSNSIFECIPLKLMLCFVALGLVLYEWFPFSAFPMYAGLSSKANYFYVTDENKNPIAYKKEFGIASDAAGQMAQTRLRYQSTKHGVRNEQEVGKQFLHYLLTIREKNKKPEYKKVVLWETTVSLNGKRIDKHEHQMASISVP